MSDDRLPGHGKDASFNAAAMISLCNKPASRQNKGENHGTNRPAEPILSANRLFFVGWVTLVYSTKKGRRMERIALLQKFPKRMPDPCARIAHQEVGIQKNGEISAPARVGNSCVGRMIGIGFGRAVGAKPLIERWLLSGSTGFGH